MANININVAGKVFLNFAASSLTMIRDQNNSVPVTINYTNGTGQILSTNQTLYTIGTPGQPGYLRVSSQSGTSLNGTGSFQVVVEGIPTATQADGTVIFQYDQSNITLNIDYNSKPVASDLNLDVDNRGMHNFTVAEFVNLYTDYDSDTLSEIQINGTTTGYEYDVNGTNNFVALTSGQWIPVNNISRIRFVAADQNTAYLQSNPYKVKDAQGVISL